jgi:hypothetical protein
MLSSRLKTTGSSFMDDNTLAAEERARQREETSRKLMLSQLRYEARAREDARINKPPPAQVTVLPREA